MDELEELRRKKLQELQRQQQDAYQRQAEQESQAQQQIQQLEAAIRQLLSKEALERYGNLKSAHPEKAVQLLVVLGQLAQAGKISQQITDDQLKELLRQMEPKKKEFRINKR